MVEVRRREGALHRLRRWRDLGERLAEANGDAALHLTPNVGRVDDPSEIVHRGVTDYLDGAHVRIDLDLTGVTAVRAASELQRGLPLAVQQPWILRHELRKADRLARSSDRKDAPFEPNSLVVDVPRPGGHDARLRDHDVDRPLDRDRGRQRRFRASGAAADRQGVAVAFPDDDRVGRKAQLVGNVERDGACMVLSGGLRADRDGHCSVGAELQSGALVR